MTDPSSRRPLSPWGIADQAVLYVASAVGFGLLAIAWWGTSGTARVSHQMPWVSLGGVALIVLGTGNTMWLLLGRRAVADRRRLLLEPYARVAPTAGAATTPTGRAGPRPVTAPGMQHYHRATCQLVAGKATSTATVAGHERAGRRPCGMCRP